MTVLANLTNSGANRLRMAQDRAATETRKIGRYTLTMRWHHSNPPMSRVCCVCNGVKAGGIVRHTKPLSDVQTHGFCSQCYDVELEKFTLTCGGKNVTI
jgi:hypothetical protein